MVVFNMAFFKKQKKEPVRLHKKETNEKNEWHRFLIIVGITLGFALLLFLFILLCMTIVPQTYGFFWW